MALRKSLVQSLADRLKLWTGTAVIPRIAWRRRIFKGFKSPRIQRPQTTWWILVRPRASEAGDTVPLPDHRLCCQWLAWLLLSLFLFKCQHSERRFQEFLLDFEWRVGAWILAISAPLHLIPECVARVPVSLWGSGG